jgi:hypothetical protein
LNKTASNGGGRITYRTINTPCSAGTWPGDPMPGASFRARAAFGNCAGHCRGKANEAGPRVIYYWITPGQQILMLTLYRKGDVTNLTRQQIKKLMQLILVLKPLEYNHE